MSSIDSRANHDPITFGLAFPMNKPDASSQTNLSFYDSEYYQTHYGYLQTSKQRNLIGEFYRQRIFEKLLGNAKTILDFGAGHGALSALVNAHCYDASSIATAALKAQGRVAYDTTEAVPESYFDAIFSSHTLEHVSDPVTQLKIFRRWLVDNGKLVLILPIEPMPGVPTKAEDDNLHLFDWNFQQLTNILMYSGFKILHQEVFHGPFLLNSLGKLFSPEKAARIASYAGKLKRSYPQSLTVASI